MTSWWFWPVEIWRLGNHEFRQAIWHSLVTIPSILFLTTVVTALLCFHQYSRRFVVNDSINTGVAYHDADARSWRSELCPLSEQNCCDNEVEPDNVWTRPSTYEVRNWRGATALAILAVRYQCTCMLLARMPECEYCLKYDAEQYAMQRPR